MEDKRPISELNVMTDTEKHYRAWERLEEYHLENMDYKAVMRDKWSLLVWGSKGGN